MNFDETRNLLDMMIEDARRLCVRSPVLFRMSTRTRIINSKETRYGVDHSQYFRTISTSKGIQEIIRLSMGYYDALDPEGSTDTNQQFIRPRFLQMLTLLLSFLNNDDLEDIAGILEATYKIKADRKHLEILFLKVLPLMSVNSKIFLEALIPTIEGYPLQYPVHEEGESALWDFFVQRILQSGYLLPGGLENLGRETLSWVVNWPENGFKSTEIFRHLQYAGCRLKAINEISPMELHPEMSLKELTVRMIDGTQYIIDSRDLERITRMSTGKYIMVDARQNSRKHYLEIKELHVNSQVDAAIAKCNLIIDQWNKWLAAPRHRLTKLLPSKKHLESAMLNNLSGTGRMTLHLAQLNQDVLTVAYKVEGRKVTRRDAWRNMHSAIRSVRVVQQDLESRSRDLFAQKGGEAQNLTQQLNAVGVLLNQADEQCRRIGEEEDKRDEPIEQVVYPSGDGVGEMPVWHDYAAKSRNGSDLHLEAKVTRVSGVDWRSDGLAEVSLTGYSSRYLASPVGHGIINPNDEISIGDRAVLAGHYLILAEPADSDGKFFMTNYLRVTSIQQLGKSNRGKLRAKSEAMSEIVFV